MKKKILTLSVIHQHPRVLLGMKKRGFGEGMWNGFGGKVEEGESIEDAAKREVEEEAGISASDLKRVGCIEFIFSEGDTPKEIHEVHVFRIESFAGNPKETEEMKPQWFFIDEIPFSEMWPDDRYWFPLFLRGSLFKGKVFFDESFAMKDHSFEPVTAI